MSVRYRPQPRNFRWRPPSNQPVGWSRAERLSAALDPSEYAKLGLSVGGAPRNVVPPGITPGSHYTPIPRNRLKTVADSPLSLQERIQVLGRQEYIPQSGIEDNQGDPFALLPEVSEQTRTPLDPGIDTPSFVNPYRTVMYSITGLSSTIPTRALLGNLRRAYLIVFNNGPGNLFFGLGTDPNTGGVNVLTLVSTQAYEQVGGGFYLPPNPWYPDGLTIMSSFVSPEYVSLLTDAAGATATIVEGTYAPPRAGSQISVSR